MRTVIFIPALPRMSGGIAVLYGLLYVLLQLEQTALLVGAVALFGVLALLMALTRKVNWYDKKPEASAVVG